MAQHWNHREGVKRERTRWYVTDKQHALWFQGEARRREDLEDTPPTLRAMPVVVARFCGR